MILIADDRATLCTIMNNSTTRPNCGNPPLPPISSGDIYFPLATDHEYLSFVRSWNKALCTDGISFAREILSQSIQLLSTVDISVQEDCILLAEILPSLASSLCLIPSCIPTLSVKYAMELLPFVSRCAKLIDKMILLSNDKSNSTNTLLGGPREGVWVLCSEFTESDNKSSDDSESLKYSVLLQRKSLEDTTNDYTWYHGESANTEGSLLNSHVSMIGVACGTRVQFVEEWCSTREEETRSSFEDCARESLSSTVIDARLSLDGAKFEGVRHHAQKRSAERIIGHFQYQLPRGNTLTTEGKREAARQKWIQTESLLCLAAGHLSLILCSQTSLSDIDKDFEEIPEAKETRVSSLLTSSILSKGRRDHDGKHVRRAIHSAWERCRSVEPVESSIVQQWQDNIYADLLNASSTDDGRRMKEAISIFEQTSNGVMACQQGSLSCLCPEHYAPAQKMLAAVIFYHCNSENEVEPLAQAKVAMKALEATRQIMENKIRNALIGAETSVPRKEVCEKCCLLLSLIAHFLFEFSCAHNVGNTLSMQSIIDEIANIFKSIETEADIESIRLKLDAETEKSIMRYVGLRSLQLLLHPEGSLQGIQVRAAIESTLVSLPRLLHPTVRNMATPPELDPNDRTLTVHLTTSIAGCAASVQTCIHSCVRSLYGKIGAILASSLVEEPTSLILGLLASYFTVFHPEDYRESLLELMPSLKNIITHYRDRVQVLSHEEEKSSTDRLLVNIILKQVYQRVLQTSALILLTTCAQLSPESSISPLLVEILSDHLLHEIAEAMPVVAENTRLTRDQEEVDAVVQDWFIGSSTASSKPQLKHSNDKEIQSPSKGLTYLSHYATSSTRCATSISETPPSTMYFGQLLNILHVALNALPFIEAIKKRASVLFSAFGFQLANKDQDVKDGCLPLNSLPLKFRRRILRLLRPLLLSMDADLLLIRQLFQVAGSIADVTRQGRNKIVSNNELLLTQAAVSLLRYLHMFSKTWRKAIHQSVTDALGTLNLPPSIFSGILSFFGGAPGSLQPGSFVVIEPDVRTPSASSTGSTRSRSSNSLSGAAYNLSSGSGTEEIITGLRRHSALSGILGSVDTLAGSCEVIVIGNKSHVQLPPSTGADYCRSHSRVTIRAVRVSSRRVSAAGKFSRFSFLWLHPHLPRFFYADFSASASKR